MHLYFVILFFLGLHVNTLKGQFCSSGRQRGDLCYVIQKESLTWQRSQVKCQGDGGDLVAIGDQETQSFIETYLKDENVNQIWVGGKEHVDSDWMWIKGGDYLEQQGCYEMDATNKEYKTPLTPAQIYPTLCVEACDNSSYPYATIGATKEGTACRCEGSYIRHKTAEGCTNICQGDSAFTCGGWHQQFIHRVGGAYGDWALSQPNNYQGYQTCGVLDGNSGYKLADEKCSTNHTYICLLNIESQFCNRPGYTWMGACYYINNVGNNWVAAREDCLMRRGDLLDIQSQGEFDVITDLLPDPGVNKDRKYWVGLTRAPWMWSTGETFSYYNWNSGSPILPRDKYWNCVQYPFERCGCTMMSGSNSFRWSHDDCDSRYFSMCQIRRPTTTSALTKPTIPTIPTTTTITIPTIPTTTTTTGIPRVTPQVGSCPGGRIINSICHLLVDANSTYEEAATYCHQRNAYLASVVNGQYQATLAIYLSDMDIKEVWIGARHNGTLWKWVSGSVVGGQGCYQDDPDPKKRDLKYEVPAISNLRPADCVERCRLDKYLYAGVQNGSRCFCGDSFGRLNSTESCVDRCVGSPQDPDLTEWCGGENKNFIYYVHGDYSWWMFNEPNDWDGKQSCGVLNGNSQFKFADERCYKRLPYICTINQALDSCVGAGYMVRPAVSRCYYLGTDSKSWYKAREDCQKRNGDLATVDTKEIHDDIKAVAASGSDGKQWIGLIKGIWSWDNKRQMRFTNWMPTEPALYGGCAIMSKLETFHWMSVPCNQRKAFICQYGVPHDIAGTVKPDPTAGPRSTRTTALTSPSTTPSSTPSSMPPSTPSTRPSTSPSTSPSTKPSTRPSTKPSTPSTTPTTKPTEKTTKSGNNGNGSGTTGNGGGVTQPDPTTAGKTVDPPTEPDAGAVTEAGLSAGYIALIILGFILLICLIIIIVLCCLYKKQKRTDKVAASEYSFDARPYAPFPESASLDGTAMTRSPREAIFIPNGNYASSGIFTTANHSGVGYTSNGYATHGYIDKPSWQDTSRSKRSIYIEDK